MRGEDLSRGGKGASPARLSSSIGVARPRVLPSAAPAIAPDLTAETSSSASPSATSSRRHFSLSEDPLRGQDSERVSRRSHVRGRCASAFGTFQRQSVDSSLKSLRLGARVGVRRSISSDPKDFSAPLHVFCGPYKISESRAGRFLNSRRATLPPTGFLGHHHPGGGVRLPALAHHAWGKRGLKEEEEKKKGGKRSNIS